MIVNPENGLYLSANARAERYIAVVKWDRFHAAVIEQCAKKVFPKIEVVVFHRGEEALDYVRARPAWLGLVGLSLPDVDGLDLLARIFRERSVTRLLVVSGRRDERTRSFLRAAPINGYFDCATEIPETLTEAVQRVGKGGDWVSSSLFEMDACVVRPPLQRMLTLTELQVFAVIGDGSDDKIAADRLKLSSKTAHTHRQHIMRKLGVQTRTELVREALHYGIVRIGEHGRVLRPGFDWPNGIRLTSDLKAGGK